MASGDAHTCASDAWKMREAELRGWLRGRFAGDEAMADDLLQTVFSKALRQGPRFCGLTDARP